MSATVSAFDLWAWKTKIAATDATELIKASLFMYKELTFKAGWSEDHL
jgi:hypothetical protein